MVEILLQNILDYLKNLFSVNETNNDTVVTVEVTETVTDESNNH